jgi:AcrR family transcriptional regulator
MTRDSKAAIIAAGRAEFGKRGYAETQIEQVARLAGVTVDVLYANFRTKKLLFEAVFESVHIELVTASTLAAGTVTAPIDMFVAAFDAYLDALLDPGVRRIAMEDGAEVLGFARFNELDEKYTLGALAGTLKAFSDNGALSIRDPDNVARLLLGAVARGGMHIAASADPVRARREIGAALLEVARGVIPAG